MSSIFRSRKAQITIFMIVGIILLFSSALIFYIKNQVVEGIPADFQPVIEEAPMEAQPIKIYVEKCVTDTTERALRHASSHGGYIDPSDPTYGKIFSPTMDPTESSVVPMLGTDLEKRSGLVSYWWYMKSKNTCRKDCEFGSEMPPLEKTGNGNSIQEQVEKFVSLHLDECLNEFDQFEQQGFKVETRGEPKVEVFFGEDDTSVKVDYEIIASKSGRTTTVKQFFTKLDVEYKDLYSLAADIAETEANISFLETASMNFIAMYSKPVSNDHLPPIAQYTFGPGEFYIWTRTQTQQLMENAVYPNIHMVQIIGTNNYHRNVLINDDGSADTISIGLLDKMLVTLDSRKEYENLGARFSYLPEWQTYLNINDREVLRPRSIAPMFKGPLTDLLGIGIYENGYSFSYPVIVSLEDPFAFGSKGLSFNFALEANVRYNEPMTSNVSFKDVPVPVSFFCAAEHMNAGPIAIYTDDVLTGEPIEGVQVEFIAGEESCTLGLTEMKIDNRSGFVGMFPVGSGEIKLTKAGYLPVRKRFGAFLNKSVEEEFHMMPIFTRNVTVDVVDVVYDIETKRYVMTPALGSMTPKENAFFTLNRVPDGEYGEFSTFALYNLSSGMQEFMIVPGKYEVDGQMFIPEHHIDAAQKKINVPFKKDKIIKLNETTFNPWRDGVVVLNNQTGFLEVTADDILNNDYVAMRVIRFPLPVSLSHEIKGGPDVQQMVLGEEYSAIYRDRVEPSWRKYAKN